MKILKVIGVAALLSFAWGCDSNGDDGGEIPSEIATILNANCGDCHGDPPANSAPFPIVNCNDVMAAFSGIEAAINSDDPDAVMPPGGQLPEGPLTTLNDWLDEGAPPCE